MKQQIRDILAHAVAWDHPRNPGYRNHYCAGPDCSSWPLLWHACQLGLMEPFVIADMDRGGMTTFRVTDLGKAELEIYDRRQR